MKALPAAFLLLCFCCIGARALPPAAGDKAGGAKAAEKSGEKKPNADMREACRADYHKFCKGVKTSQKRAQCLNKHLKEIAPACREALKTLPPDPKNSATLKRAGAVLSKDCKADAEKLCAGITSELKKGKCLRKNEAALSPGCRKALAKLRPPEEEPSPDRNSEGRQQAEAAMKKACSGDIGKFCASAEPGLKQGNCLMEHENDLSDDCLKTLKSLPPPEQEGGQEGQPPK